MHEGVGVDRGIDRQDEIAVPHRRSGVRDRGTGLGDRLDAGMPEFTRRALFLAGLPSLGTGEKHRPPRRLVVAVGQSRVLVFDAVFGAIAEQSPTGLGAQVVAEPLDDILLSERPADGGIVLLPNRMEQECQPQITQRQPPIGEQGTTAADVTVEHGLQIGSPNPAAAEFLPVPRLREVGLGAIELGRMDDGVFEGLAFEGLERVLGDKHADRSLRGQKPRRGFNGDPDRLRLIRPGPAARSGLGRGGLIAVVRHAGNRQAGTLQKPMRCSIQRTPKPAATRIAGVCL